MFQVQPLSAPETLAVTGGSFTLTHSKEVLHLDPGRADKALEVIKMKGFLDASGNFQDFGDHQVLTLDAQGFSDLMASTAGGKKAGDFKLSDIPKAIADRQAAKDAQAAQQAQAKP